MFHASRRDFRDGVVDKAKGRSSDPSSASGYLQDWAGRVAFALLLRGWNANTNCARIEGNYVALALLLHLRFWNCGLICRCENEFAARATGKITEEVQGGSRHAVPVAFNG